MAFCRQWLLIFCALSCGGGQIFAASTREQRALAVAEQTFNDGNFERAEALLQEFLKKYPGSTSAPRADLLLAQSQFKQEKYEESLEALADHRAGAGALADKFIYWTAEAQFMTNGFAAAAENFSTVARNFPQSPLRLTAAVEAAAAWEKIQNWAGISALLGDAAGFFQRVAQTNAAEAQVINGRLLLARALVAQNDFAGSAQALAPLAALPLKPEQQWNRDSLAFANKIAVADTNAAMALTARLLELARTENNSDWQADASAKRGSVLEAMGLFKEAAATRRENLSTNAPVEKQREAILKIAALAAAENDFAGAESALEKFLATAADVSIAELVRLTLGELHLKDAAATNRLAAAQEQFDHLLNDSPNSPLAGKALLDRGWVNWLAGKYSPALADFKNAVSRLPFTNDLAVAIFKSADTEFVLTNFPAARDDYHLLLEKFANVPVVMRSLGDSALYQIVRANLELKNRAETEKSLKNLLDRFPKLGTADNSLLLVAEHAANQSDARRLLRQFGETFPTSPLRAQADFALARTYEREQNWLAAVTNHEVWMERYPTNDLRPQVAYAQAWANDRAGREANAFLQFSNFVVQFPNDPDAPLAQWWLADNLFRAGAFEAAEKNYESVWQNPAWKSSTNLFFQAQWMSGRAAMGRQGWKDAAGYFDALLHDTNCPPELAMQTRFSYGAVLMQMPSADTNNPLANYIGATNIFDQIYRAYPTNNVGLRARGELANCAMQLGDFAVATNYYLQVAGSPLADAEMQAGAYVGLGLTYEKMASALPADAARTFLELAKNAYLQVVDRATNPGRDEPQDEFWTKKAGLSALRLMSAAGDSHTNFFARMEGLFPQLKDTLEKKRISLSAQKN